MLVFVLNKHGKPLMPCKPSKARKLLKQGKAKIVQYEPCKGRNKPNREAKRKGDSDKKR